MTSAIPVQRSNHIITLIYEIHIIELQIKTELYVDHRSEGVKYGINTNSQLTSSQLA